MPISVNTFEIIRLTIDASYTFHIDFLIHSVSYHILKCLVFSLVSMGVPNRHDSSLSISTMELQGVLDDSTTPREAKIFRQILHSKAFICIVEVVILDTTSGLMRSDECNDVCWSNTHHHVIKEFGGTRNLAYRCTQHGID